MIRCQPGFQTEAGILSYTSLVHLSAAGLESLSSSTVTPHCVVGLCVSVSLLSAAARALLLSVLMPAACSSRTTSSMFPRLCSSLHSHLHARNWLKCVEVYLRVCVMRDKKRNFGFGDVCVCDVLLGFSVLLL